MKRKLVLENGLVFEGEAFGSTNERIAELVYNTSVVGYQETLSDPSKQFITTASIEPVDEFVMKHAFEPFGAFANFSISFSFSNIRFENSDVLK